MSQNRILEGKLAIVTGASRGIGVAICENLAAKGCSLVMTYTSDKSTQSITEHANHLTKKHNIKAHPVQADMGSPQAPAYIISVTRSHFGHPRTGNLQIDIIINNAGVASINHMESTPAAELSEIFTHHYAVNVLGPLLLVQACLPYLPTDRSGRIVNTSSVSASMGMPGQSIYGGTKAALEAMTRSWSRELGERCTVNAINPGPVDTEMYSGNSPDFLQFMRSFIEKTPRAQVKEGIDHPDLVSRVTRGDLGGREATTHEIAGIVGMLCLPEATWCTGSVICANGGMKFST